MRVRERDEGRWSSVTSILIVSMLLLGNLAAVAVGRETQFLQGEQWEGEGIKALLLQKLYLTFRKQRISNHRRQ